MKKLIKTIAVSAILLTGAGANDLQKALKLDKSSFCGMLKKYEDSDVNGLMNRVVSYPELTQYIVTANTLKQHNRELEVLQNDPSSNGDRIAVLNQVYNNMNGTYYDEESGVMYSGNMYDIPQQIANKYKSLAGEISFDLMQQLGGSGMSTKIGWEQFVRNYMSFHKYATLQGSKNALLSKNYKFIDKSYNELALYLNTIYNEDFKNSKSNIKGLDQESIDKLASIYFYSTYANEGMGVDKFIKFIKTYRNNAKLKKLFKDVILLNKDNEIVLNDIKNLNNQAGTAKIIEDIREGCISHRTKTIEDVVKYKKTELEEKVDEILEVCKIYQYPEIHIRSIMNDEFKRSTFVADMEFAFDKHKNEFGSHSSVKNSIHTKKSSTKSNYDFYLMLNSDKMINIFGGNIENLKAKGIINKEGNYGSVGIGYLNFLTKAYNLPSEELRRIGLFFALIDSSIKGKSSTIGISANIFETERFIINFITNNNKIEEKYRSLANEFLKELTTESSSINIDSEFMDFGKALDVIKKSKELDELEKYNDIECEKYVPRAIFKAYKDSRYEKAKNQSKEKICNIYETRFNADNDVFEVKDYENLLKIEATNPDLNYFYTNKNSDIKYGYTKLREDALRTIYSKLSDEISKDMLQELNLDKTKENPIINGDVIIEACESETTKTIEDIRNYKYQFKKFLSREIDYLCGLMSAKRDGDTISKEIEKMEVVSKALGKKPKSSSDIKDECNSFFRISGGTTYGDVID